jgi:hypothetical protein
MFFANLWDDSGVNKALVHSFCGHCKGIAKFADVEDCLNHGEADKANTSERSAKLPFTFFVLSIYKCWLQN